MAKGFQDLEVWQFSMDLTVLVYRVTAGFPKFELYGLGTQMRRAAVSISSNIAEGSGRATGKDFRHFVILARGSACELQTQLLIAERLGYSSVAELQEAERLADRVGRMLNGLAKTLLNAPPISQKDPARISELY